MITRFILWVFLIGAATASLAEVVAVRSGEHENFSRIVLKISVGTQWSLSQSADSSELTVDLPEAEFDISQVFERIPRTRLSDLSQAGPGQPLRLSLGCPCNVTAFVQSGTLLVVDISDPENTGLAQQNPTRAFPNLLSDRPGGVQLSWNLSGLPTGAGTTPDRDGRSDHDATAAIPLNTKKSSMNASEARLLGQISRATSHGLLEPSEDAIVRRDEPENVSQEPDAASRNLSPQINIRASTRIETDRLETAGSIEQAASPNTCMDARLVALPDWGTQASFDSQIGAARADLVGEFDTIDEKRVIGLARTLLYFGFGAEAKRVLELSYDPSETQAALHALAEILDYGQALSENPFKGQQRCTSDVALWAFLADPKNATALGNNTNSVLIAFSRLPEHLKILVGPTLSNRFIDIDDATSSETVLGNVERIIHQPEPVLDLAIATKARHRGDPELASDRLTEVAHGGSNQSPLALIALVDTLVSTQRAASPEVPDLIATYISEYRGTDTGFALQQAHVLALASTGRFDEAYDVFSKYGFKGTEQETQRVEDHIIRLLTEQADDITFLLHVMDFVNHVPRVLSNGLVNAISERLVALGFPEPARKLLSKPGSQRKNQSSGTLMARISLMEDLPHRALVDLLDVSGPEANLLRAQALLSIGDYANAGATLENSGADAARAYWHAKDWDALARQNEPDLVKMAEIARSLEAAEGVQPELEPLASARALTNSSVETRKNIDNLLEFSDLTIENP